MDRAEKRRQQKEARKKGAGSAAVTPDEDHAANAVRMSIEIQETCRTTACGNGLILPTRCGINTGEIIIGAIGAEDRLTFTVHGDDVNIAARLEQLNKEHGTYIMLGENTFEACRNAFDFKPVTKVTVRGRQTPTQVYTVNS